MATLYWTNVSPSRFSHFSYQKSLSRLLKCGTGADEIGIQWCRLRVKNEDSGREHEEHWPMKTVEKFAAGLAEVPSDVARTPRFIRYATPLFVLWALWLTAEYWSFGSNSYVRLHNIADESLPQLIALKANFLHRMFGRWNPFWSSGADRAALPFSRDMDGLVSFSAWSQDCSPFGCCRDVWALVHGLRCTHLWRIHFLLNRCSTGAGPGLRFSITLRFPAFPSCSGSYPAYRRSGATGRSCWQCSPVCGWVLRGVCTLACLLDPW